jgi:ssDNA-binding Zn-finger/Zn-ribbon topoisomerase 1
MRYNLAGFLTRYFFAQTSTKDVMQPKRPSPLYSPLGCGATIVLVMMLGAILYLRGGGPFSPGPLTAASPRQVALDGFASHATFEQACGRCHAPWQGITAERCESCHTSIAEQRQSRTGLHGRLHDTGRCQSCHTDHHGAEANITMLGLASFDHDRLTTFSLAAHQYDFDGRDLACHACHVENRFTAAAVNCTDCHTTAEPSFMAEHTAFFGDDCLACHDGRDTMASFDHSQVFPLEGAHAALECAGCHINQQFAGTPRNCAACHEEPVIHAGLFGTDCARCHTSQAWTPALLTQHTFPLDHGGEGKIDCLTCHTISYTEYTCYNCHEHNEAETITEHREEGITDLTDCAACHPTGLEDEAREILESNDD